MQPILTIKLILVKQFFYNFIKIKLKKQNRFGMKFSSQGLIPFIELNKFIVEDSSKCIEYLGEVFQKDLDANLTDEQKAISQALIKMAEDRYTIF